MNYDKEKLVDQLITHEGMELKVYKDSLGIETIGIGRNLVDSGVSEEEARYLCNNDIDIFIWWCPIRKSSAFFKRMEEKRSRKIMEFN